MSMHTWNTLATRSDFGIAMVLAGAVAMGGSIAWSEQRPAPEPAPEASIMGADALGPVALEVMPKLSAHAVFNRGDPTPPARAHPAAVEPKTASTCHPSWRPLETGPVGRLVIETCPSWHGNLPPPPPRTVDPSHSELPTIADFGEPGEGQQFTTIGGDARGAGVALTRSLEDSIEQSAADLAPVAEAPAPELGALDWSPSLVKSS